MAKKEKVVTILQNECIQVDLCHGQYLWIGLSDDAQDERSVIRNPLVLSSPAQLKKLIEAAQTVLATVQGTKDE